MSGCHTSHTKNLHAKSNLQNLMGVILQWTLLHIKKEKDRKKTPNTTTIKFVCIYCYLLRLDTSLPWSSTNLLQVFGIKSVLKLKITKTQVKKLLATVEKELSKKENWQSLGRTCKKVDMQTFSKPGRVLFIIVRAQVFQKHKEHWNLRLTQKLAENGQMR